MFTFNEIKKGFLHWLDSSYHERNRDLELEEKEKLIEQQIIEEEEQRKFEKTEEFLWRRKVSLDILSFKLKKHKSKI